MVCYTLVLLRKAYRLSHRELTCLQNALSLIVYASTTVARSVTFFLENIRKWPVVLVVVDSTQPERLLSTQTMIYPK